MPPEYDIATAMALSLFAYVCYVLGVKPQDRFEDYADNPPDPNTTTVPTQRKRYGWVYLGLLLSVGGWVLVWQGVGFGKFLSIFGGLSAFEDWVSMTLWTLIGIAAAAPLLGMLTAWFVALWPVYYGRTSYDDANEAHQARYYYIETSTVRVCRNRHLPWTYLWFLMWLLPWLNNNAKIFYPSGRR